MIKLSFNDIEFGLAAAENERSNKPYLLLKGFLDSNGYIDQLMNGDKFLVLGPKGSGKSAIGSRIELLSDSRTVFVKSHYLEDFPFNRFNEIIPGREEPPEVRYPSHWELLILISFIENFYLDRDIEPYEKLTKLQSVLSESGVLPSKNLSEMVTKATRREFKVGLPKILEYAYTAESGGKKLDINYLNSVLKDICYSIKGKNQHIVIIDGLDDVLTKRDKQYVSLSSLILAADRINRKFKQNSIRAKIIILCRTDLFEKLPGTNKNKIKQDSALVLDWYQDVTDIKSTNLVKLINLRAYASLNREVDVFDEYLPHYYKGNTTVIRQVFDNTRHTPRDIIQLLNKIQEHSKIQNRERPSVENIKNGLRGYSLDYLVPEIKDELVGYLSNEEIEKIILLLSAMRRPTFSLHEIEAFSQSDVSFSDLTLTKILPILYDCNAIGNIDRAGFVSWKYRNRYSSFDPHSNIIIHKGLRKGLSLP
ncbi:hypothetical protein J2741_002040 [Methanolinea mesophila]|uniref:P-loop ATPase, Sll1717 family n=1 Tax=Methanolinea mesophila TaxID=547055 RepID=UPI001AEB3442|nr:hypothetical protein [Methanolinea mesophila]MBP1929493.1 hypothetical protein [Methanolinea mesophila]